MKTLTAPHIRSIGVAARFVTAACLVGFLYFGRAVLIPFALALLIAFALQPAIRRLSSWGLPRRFAVALTTAAFALALGGMSWFIGGQIAGFAAEIPSYRANIVGKIQDGRALLSGGTIDALMNTLAGVKAQATDSAVPVTDPQSARPAPWTVKDWFDSAGLVTDPLTTFGLIVLLVVMMLLDWANLRSRLLGLMPGSVSQSTQVLSAAGDRIGRYLFLQFSYNTIFGLVTGLALWAIGLPYAALWGLCAGLFRYFPYVGPVAAAGLPILVSLVTSSGWSQVGTVAVTFVVLEVISNNFIEPWLYGSKLGVSEIGIILASVAWAYLWGPAGLVLAAPLTVCLVVIGTNVPCLGFFARLLGNEQTFSDPQQFYQRLLAGDSVEAVELARQQTRECGETGFITEVLLPTLSLARRDQAARWLPPESAALIAEEVKAVYGGIESTAPQGKQVSTGQDVVLWSLCPFTDVAIPAVLKCLGSSPYHIRLIASTEMVGFVLQDQDSEVDRPSAVALLHLSSADTARVTGLLKRISRAWPEVPLMVTRLGEAPFTTSERETFSEAGARHFATETPQLRTWFAAYASNQPATA